MNNSSLALWIGLCFVGSAIGFAVHANTLATKQSYYPETFYSDVESGSRDEQLKQTLFQILTSGHKKGSGQDTLIESCDREDKSCWQHVTLGYNAARRVLFGTIHLQELQEGGWAIQDVYCDHLSVASDYNSNPPGPGKIPDNNVMNAEHTWPQSRFTNRFSRDTQKSDLNILYPVLAHANTSRSNLEFGNVAQTISRPCEASKRGFLRSGSDQIVFEVPEHHKGNAARAIFYFSVRYQLPVSPDQEASLRSWHKSDPVDAFESSRNETIYKIQRNRNPFIDHPELVDLISDF